MTRLHRADTLLVILGVLLVWQGVFAYAGSTAITAPLATFAYAWGLLAGNFIWPHVGATMLAFAMALAISAVLGVALGVVLGLRRFAGDVAEPLIAAFYTIPKVTLYPVMLLIFGLGLSAKVAFGVIHGTVPVLLFTLTAVKTLPSVYLRTARTMRMPPRDVARHIVLPALVPEIVSGLRVGFALTLLGVIIGEMFASQRGLGFLIINGINSNNVPMTTSVTLIVVVFAVAANGALLALDRQLHHGGRLRT
ncbi:MAG: ABC transporter permease subunit [Proteobacteria bacterium]|nr:ABC transporter permease subunit [Pseudomonadota bacterium]